MKPRRPNALGHARRERSFTSRISWDQMRERLAETAGKLRAGWEPEEPQFAAPTDVRARQEGAR